MKLSTTSCARGSTRSIAAARRVLHEAFAGVCCCPLVSVTSRTRRPAATGQTSTAASASSVPRARSVVSVVAVASVGVAEPRAAHHPLMKREEGEAQAAGPHREFALFLRRWLRHTPSVQGVHSAHGRCGEAGERAGRAGVGRGSGEGWRRAQAKRTSRVVTDSNDCRLRYLPRLAANSCCPVWKQKRCVHAAQVHNIYY